MTARLGPESWGSWNLAFDVALWALCAAGLALLVEHRAKASAQ